MFLVNGQRVVDGDTISLSDELFLSQGSYIMYTTDGSYPVSWEENTLGEETPQAILYSKENLAQSLPAGEVTLRAISKNNSNWSATVTRKVFVVDEQATTSAAVRLILHSSLFILHLKKVCTLKTEKRRFANRISFSLLSTIVYKL